MSFSRSLGSDVFLFIFRTTLIFQQPKKELQERGVTLSLVGGVAMKSKMMMRPSFVRVGVNSGTTGESTGPLHAHTCTNTLRTHTHTQRECTGMSELAYNLLTTEDSAEWVCDKCISNKYIPTVRMVPTKS